MTTSVDEDLGIDPLVILSGRVSLAAPYDELLGGDRQRRLLAGLTLRRRQVVSPDWLSGVVWYGDEAPDTPGTLRTYVYRLRKALAETRGGVSIETVGGSYRLTCDRAAIDLAAFEAFAARSESQLSAGSPDDAFRTCTDALSMWRGRPYGEFADEAWALAEATRMEELFLLVEERRASAILGMGRTDEAIVELEGMCAALPTRESRVELLMRALVQAGRQGDALRAYAELSDTLRAESGLFPSPYLAELERRVLDDDESLSRPPALRTIRSFKLLNQLPSSGIVTAWRASHPSLDHEVRIDAFPAALADDRRFVANFDSHLRRLSRLEHPSIVRVDDYWREPGSAHVVSRHLRIRTLRRSIDEGLLDDLRVEDVVTHVGGALQAAHADDVVHGSVGAEVVGADDLGHWYVTGFANPNAILGEATKHDDVSAFASLLAELWSLLRPGEQVLPNEPPADLAGLLSEIRARSAPSLRAPRTADRPRLGRNPYPGLRPFDDADRELFFGRTHLVEEVLDGWTPHDRISIIVGSSGTGKSSLLHAGLLPAVRDAYGESMLVARLAPGDEPFERLAAAVRSVGSEAGARQASASLISSDGLGPAVRFAIPRDQRILIAIDQLEELFAFNSPASQGRFLQVLVDAVREDGPVRVVATLRSDHFGGLLSNGELATLTKKALLPVPPFSAAELESVVTGPAHLAGVDVEARLVSALTADLVDRPNLLPHLQHTLRLMFASRGGNTLTYRAYEEVGGITGSLARTGEEVYEGSDAVERLALRRVLRRLTHVDDDGTTSRRVALVEDVTEADRAVGRVLDALASKRLVVFDNERATRAPTVTITHEALVRAWPRFVEWQRADTELTRVLEELSERSRTWAELEYDEGELLRGGRLDRMREALPELVGELSDREQAYVEASEVAHEESLERDRRRRQVLATMLVVAVVGLVASLAAGIFAFRERAESDRAAIAAARDAEVARAAEREAEAQKAVADERRLLASIRLTAKDDPRLALLLAAHLYEDSPKFDTLSALQETLVELPRGFEGFVGPAVPYLDVSLSPDGRFVAGATAEGATVWNIANGEVVYAIDVDGPRAVELTDSVLYVVDLSGLRRIDLVTNVVTGIAVPLTPRSLFARGEFLAVGGQDGRVAISTDAMAFEVLPGSLEAPVDHVDGDAAGEYLVATSRTSNSIAVVWDVSKMAQLGVITHDGPHGTIHTSDAVIVGDTVASIGINNSLQMRQLPSLREVEPVRFVGTALQARGEDQVVAIGSAGWLSLHSIEDGREEDRLEGVGERRSGPLAVSANGTLAAIGTSDGIELWSLEGGRALPESWFFDGDYSTYVPSNTQWSPSGLQALERPQPSNPGLVLFRDGQPTDLWDQVGLPTAMSMQVAGDIGMVMLADRSVRFVQFDGDRLSAYPDLGLRWLSALDNWVYDRFEDTIALLTGRDNTLAVVERRGEELVLVALVDIPLDDWVVLWFSEDGSRLYTTTLTNEIIAWSTDTWEEIGRAQDALPDRLVGGTSMGDGTGLLLTIDGAMHRFEENARGFSILETRQLSNAGFAPLLFSTIVESGHLVTVAPDRVGGAARMWDLAEGAQVGVTFGIVGEDGSFPSADTLMTHEVDVAHFWPLDVASWPGHACRIAGRSLTEAEWHEHGPRGVPFTPVCE